ncbi:MAG: DUF2079 domain-containing protein [Candidatus Kerfeldbacteria bacterium]|nr:DUF2079 domain-containing protein [Candidatus Kerfeldbacteria bacterium]
MDYEAVFRIRLLAFGGLIVVGAGLVALFVRLRIAQRADRWCALHPRALPMFFAIGLVVFLAYFGTLALLRHYDLQTSILDLGNVEQTFWNTAHGQPFRMTTDTSEVSVPDTRLAFHIEPIILPLSLFYWLLPRTETLLFLQLLAVAGSAVLVGLIARRLLDSPFAAVAFFTATLLAQPLWSALTFDIHPVVYALPSFLFAFWFFVQGQYGRSLLASVALMLCREDAAIVALLFGVFLLLHRRSRWAGLALTVLAGSWLVALTAIFQHFHPQGYEYLWRIEGLDQVLTGATDWRAFVADVGRFHYLLWLLVPLAFLPLVGLDVAILGAAAIGIMVVGGSDRELLGDLHYHLLGDGALLVAAVVGAARIVRRQRRRGHRSQAPVVSVLVASILVAALFGGRAVFPAPDWQRLATIREAARAIPASASVAASANAGPWVVRRSELYLLKSPRRARADYVLALDCAADVCDNLPKMQYDEILAEVGTDPTAQLILYRDGVRLYEHRPSLSIRTAPSIP